LLYSPNRSCLDSRWSSRRTFLSGLCACAIFAFVSIAVFAPFGDAQGQGQADARFIGPKVVLVRMAACCPDLACPEAEAMLADELDATALETEFVNGGAAESGGGGERLAVRLGGRRGAALRVFRDAEKPGCTMEMWAQGSGASEAIYRKIRLPDSGDRDAAMNAAIESAEAVFAGLLELKLVSEEMLRRGKGEPAESEPEVDAGADADAGTDDAGVPPAANPGEPGVASPPPRDRRLGIGLGMGVVWSPGGVGARGAVRLAFDARFVPWLTLRADAWVTVLGEDLEARGARATFDAATFRLSAFYEFVRRGPVRPALGICGGGIVVWTEGAGAAEYVGGQETALAGYAGGTGRFAVVLGKWIRVELGAAVGAVMPEVRVRFAGRDVAQFGRPMVDAFAQVELSFF
jgi:hypothetical protein